MEPRPDRSSPPVEPNRRYRLFDDAGGSREVDITGVRGDLAYGFVVGSGRQVQLDGVSRLVEDGDLVPVENG